MTHESASQERKAAKHFRSHRVKSRHARHYRHARYRHARNARGHHRHARRAAAHVSAMPNGGPLGQILSALPVPFAVAPEPRVRVARDGGIPSAYSGAVARHAQAHGIPQSLVHRVIMRESRYNPKVIGRCGCYGLMQIKPATARAMGYRGTVAGLLDAETNMTYAVKYLAGAYRAARGNEAHAVTLYARGYYHQAKAQGFSPYTGQSIKRRRVGALAGDNGERLGRI